jgi:hypothetical protein
VLTVLASLPRMPGLSPSSSYACTYHSSSVFPPKITAVLSLGAEAKNSSCLNLTLMSQRPANAREGAQTRPSWSTSSSSIRMFTEGCGRLGVSGIRREYEFPHHNEEATARSGVLLSSGDSAPELGVVDGSLAISLFSLELLLMFGPSLSCIRRHQPKNCHSRRCMTTFVLPLRCRLHLYFRRQCIAQPCHRSGCAAFQ